MSSTAAPRLQSLPTGLVGSYPQPEWLVDHVVLRGAPVPRVRAPEVWRISTENLREAQDDATLVAIAEQTRAGVDLVTDGEIRRESYSGSFANSLSGIDPDRQGTVTTRSGVSRPVPIFSGPVQRTSPVEVDNVKFLRSHTTLPTKVTLPGPFTMSEQAETTYYKDRATLAHDLADAINDEVRDLFAAGADVVQLDEPWMERWAERAREYGVSVLNRAVRDIEGTVAVHVCFGYASVVPNKPSRYEFLQELNESNVDQVSIETAQCNLELEQLSLLPSKTIILGVIDLLDHNIETPDTVARRIEAALEFVSPDRLVIAPDCGMKFLPREIAFGKLKAMVDGASLVRAALP